MAQLLLLLMLASQQQRRRRRQQQAAPSALPCLERSMRTTRAATDGTPNKWLRSGGERCVNPNARLRGNTERAEPSRGDFATQRSAGRSRPARGRRFDGERTTATTIQAEPRRAQQIRAERDPSREIREIGPARPGNSRSRRASSSRLLRRARLLLLFLTLPPLLRRAPVSLKFTLS